MYILNFYYLIIKYIISDYIIKFRLDLYFLIVYIFNVKQPCSFRGLFCIDSACTATNNIDISLLVDISMTPIFMSQFSLNTRAAGCCFKSNSFILIQYLLKEH